MKTLRLLLVAATASIAISVPAALLAKQKGDKPAKESSSPAKPRLMLRAQPTVGVAPAESGADR